MHCDPIKRSFHSDAAHQLCRVMHSFKSFESQIELNCIFEGFFLVVVFEGESLVGLRMAREVEGLSKGRFLLLLMFQITFIFGFQGI